LINKEYYIPFFNFGGTSIEENKNVARRPSDLYMNQISLSNLYLYARDFRENGNLGCDNSFFNGFTGMCSNHELGDVMERINFFERFHTAILSTSNTNSDIVYFQENFIFDSEYGLTKEIVWENLENCSIEKNENILNINSRIGKTNTENIASGKTAIAIGDTDSLEIVFQNTYESLSLGFTSSNSNSIANSEVKINLKNNRLELFDDSGILDVFENDLLSTIIFLRVINKSGKLEFKANGKPFHTHIIEGDNKFYRTLFELTDDCSNISNIYSNKEFIDADNDGFGVGYDCDDTDSNINPNAVEIPNNNIDENCDGSDIVVSSVHKLADTIVSIYPNPSKDVINISVKGTLDFKANLFSMEGKLVKTINNSNMMRVNDVTVGTYLLEVIEHRTGQKLIEKIVIQ